MEAKEDPYIDMKVLILQMLLLLMFFHSCSIDHQKMAIYISVSKGVPNLIGNEEECLPPLLMGIIL